MTKLRHLPSKKMRMANDTDVSSAHASMVHFNDLESEELIEDLTDEDMYGDSLSSEEESYSEGSMPTDEIKGDPNYADSSPMVNTIPFGETINLDAIGKTTLTGQKADGTKYTLLKFNEPHFIKFDWPIKFDNKYTDSNGRIHMTVDLNNTPEILSKLKSINDQVENLICRMNK